jgi:hypothetical protein
MQYFFIGDSWASKAFNEHNHEEREPNADDVRLSDLWSLDYNYKSLGGKGNLDCMDHVISMNLPPELPIVWIYTEPGRDYARVYNDQNPHGWLTRDDYFDIRPKLEKQILIKIKNHIPNPIALIGGLSDVDVDLADSLGYTVIHPSWQQWIATQIGVELKQGWGAPDLLWRMHTDNVAQPSKTSTYECLDWLKFYKSAESADYMFMYHPTLRANREFGEYLRPQITEWITDCV